jgi:AAA family ATP:ADP antiporter
MSGPPESRRVVFAGAGAAALLVAQQVAGKATRDALFLSHYPAASLPLLMIASSVVAMASALAIAHVLARRAPRQVLPGLVGLHAALLLMQTLLAFETPRVAAVLVYVQMAATGGTLLSAYWSVVNERFDPWRAKQVMGTLGLGASVGGVAGGLFAWTGSTALPVPAMLLVIAALNVAALVAIVLFSGDAPRAGSDETPVLPSLRAMRGAPYLRHLAAVVALGAATEALIDYVLKARAAASIASGSELMAFFALYHTGMGLLALAFQWLLVRPGLETFGLAGAVAFRPVAVAAAAVAGLLDPRLWSAALCRGAHEVLSNSLFRSGYELLYTPLPDHQKRATKQLVDVAFDKLGTLAGAAMAFAAVRAMSAPDRGLLAVAGGLSLVALGLTGRLHRGYITALEESLRAGKVRLDPSDVVDSTTRLTMAEVRHPSGPDTPSPRPATSTSSHPSASDPLLHRIADLRSEDPARVRAALEGDDLDPALVPHLAALLTQSDFYLDALRALRVLAVRATGQIVDLLLDPEAPILVRRRLPRVLKSAPSQRAADGLMLALGDPSFEVRSQCVQALTALTSRAPQVRVSGEAAFAAARRELEGPEPNLEYVFTLLALVLDREPMRMASWALRGNDAALKGTALEYLANVVPADLRLLLWPHVGAAPRAAVRPVNELLTELRSGRVRRRP